MIRAVVGKVPNLNIQMPPRSFWKGVATTAAMDIRERTETKGVDFEGKRFKAYTPKYAKWKAAKGRSKKGIATFPNLSLSTDMLGSMAGGITTRKDGASILLSGTEGKKAWGNEANGRLFFYLSKSEQNAILKDVSEWIVKKNRLHG